MGTCGSMTLLENMAMADNKNRPYSITPGINRKLTRPEHFEAFLEAPVRVKLIRPLENGVRELEGILIDVAENGDFEVITEEDTTVTFTRKECASVNLIEDYD